MSISFSGSTHTMDFVAFSPAMGNWRENLCFSHVLKYTTGWESDGKKVPILREKYKYQFGGSRHKMAFVAFSRAMGNRWEKRCISQIMRFTNFFPWIGWKWHCFRVLKCDQFFRSSHRWCSVKKGVLKNFANFAGIHLCSNLPSGLQLY